MQGLVLVFSFYDSCLNCHFFTNDSCNKTTTDTGQQNIATTVV